MLAEPVAGTAEKHKQSAAMVVSNRDFKFFSFSLLELLPDIALLNY
jgi:hypothetical protein